jgi:autotransporter passenger strand-loop-strand repeat protein
VRLGGELDVAVEGRTSVTTVLSGGRENVNSGGSATGLTITLASGGTLQARIGGIFGGATLSGGLIEIVSGGVVGASEFDFDTGGNLQFDDSQHFGGKISGFAFNEAPGNTGGTLTVSDGTRTANILLLGQYATGNFTKLSDGNGGTSITDPPIVGQYSFCYPYG